MGEALDVAAELVEPAKFELYWPSIVKELNHVPHIWAQYFTLDSIRDAVMNERWQVWTLGSKTQVSAVVFTTIIDYPAARVLQLVLAFGVGFTDYIPQLTATLEKFALHNECVRCEITGRAGWEKFLPGFKRTHVALSRNLEFAKVQ